VSKIKKLNKEEERSIYNDTTEFIDVINEDYDFYQSLITLMRKGENSVSLNRKIIQKQIDEQWVSIIEAALPALDMVIRTPRKDIKETEEVLPVELSRNITPRSLRHLAQHTDYIKAIDKDGTVTPSKILNVFRDETWETYENKFINTLIDRLCLFVERRYEKLVIYGQDEYSSEMAFNVEMKVKETDVKINFQIETKDNKDSKSKKEEIKSDNTLLNLKINPNADLWSRVEHLRKIVLNFKSSALCVALGKSFVRPPIMRTNAIMKNIYLRQCLDLWQFIESYDKVGYEIFSSETPERPNKELTKNLYSLMAFQYVVFRYNTYGEMDEELSNKGLKSAQKIEPKFIRSYSDEIGEDFDIYENETRRIYVPVPGQVKQKKLTLVETKIKKAIDSAIINEKKRQKEEQKKHNTIAKSRKKDVSN